MNAWFLRAAPCPKCHGQMIKLQRNPDATDLWLGMFGEVPYWLIFGACLTLGLLEWVAGAVAVLIPALMLYVHRLDQHRYACQSCGVVLRRDEVGNDDACSPCQDRRSI